MLLALVMVLTLLPLTAFAASYTGYEALDATQPVTFDGATVTWNGKTWNLDANTIFLDYRLDDEQIADNPYAFNDAQEAFKAVTDGTAEKLAIKSWTDYEGEQIQIKTEDDKVYVFHAANCVLAAE